jgi:hypothetical protein
VGHPYWGGIHQTYAITALQKLPIWQSPSYNVSINRAGELWVGYQRLSSAC